MRIALVIALLAQVAVAAPPVDPALKKRAAEQFRLGGEQFKKGSYDAAAALFKSAYDLVPDAAYLYNIGICYERRKAWRLAVEYFDKFLTETPESPLAGDAKARREVAARSRAADMATIEVTSTPPGARAVATTVSGTVSCEATPCKLTVDAGPVTLELTLFEATRTLSQSLAPADVWAATAEFKDVDVPKSAKVTVVVDVPGATVLVDGAPATPGVSIPLAAGPHTIEVSKTGYERFRQQATLTAGQDWTVGVNLRAERVSGSSGQRVAAWVSFGIGGAAVITGTVFAVLAHNADQHAVELNGLPPSEDNPAAFDDAKSTANTRALVSDVSMGVAVAGAVTGLIL